MFFLSSWFWKHCAVYGATIGFKRLASFKDIQQSVCLSIGFQSARQPRKKSDFLLNLENVRSYFWQIIGCHQCQFLTDFKCSSPSLTFYILPIGDDRNRKLLSPSAKRFRRSGEGSWITKPSRKSPSHPHRRSISLAVPQFANKWYVHFYWWITGVLVYPLFVTNAHLTWHEVQWLTKADVYSLFERNEIRFPDIMWLYVF